MKQETVTYPWKSMSCIICEPPVSFHTTQAQGVNGAGRQDSDSLLESNDNHCMKLARSYLLDTMLFSL